MRIFHVVVKDKEMGDEVAVSATKQRRAYDEATRLRKTFRDVKVRPGELKTGYNEPPDIE